MGLSRRLLVSGGVSGERSAVAVDDPSSKADLPGLAGGVARGWHPRTGARKARTDKAWIRAASGRVSPYGEPCLHRPGRERFTSGFHGCNPVPDAIEQRQTHTFPWLIGPGPIKRKGDVR